jgi:hypothetical protein
MLGRQKTRMKMITTGEAQLCTYLPRPRQLRGLPVSSKATTCSTPDPLFQRPPASPALHRISCAGFDLVSVLRGKLEGLVPHSDIELLCALADATVALADERADKEEQRADAFAEQIFMLMNNLADYKAQFEPRIILEQQLLANYSHFFPETKRFPSMAKLYKEFCSNYLLFNNGSLQPLALEMLDSLDGAGEGKMVESDLPALATMLHRPHHKGAQRVEGYGWLTGGAISRGLAASVAIGALMHLCQSAGVEIVLWQLSLDHLNPPHVRTHTYDLDDCTASPGWSRLPAPK